MVGYCAGWSLENLLKKGFGHVPNQVHSFPAKHLETATLHMVNFIGTMQGEFAGAQAFSSVDTYLAPFVRVGQPGLRTCQAGHSEAHLRTERSLTVGVADALFQLDLRLDGSR